MVVRGQRQYVLCSTLEAKVGKKLSIGEQFTLPTGTWKVVSIDDTRYFVEWEY